MGLWSWSLQTLLLSPTSNHQKVCLIFIEEKYDYVKNRLVLPNKNVIYFLGGRNPRIISHEDGSVISEIPANFHGDSSKHVLLYKDSLLFKVYCKFDEYEEKPIRMVCLCDLNNPSKKIKKIPIEIGIQDFTFIDNQSGVVLIHHASPKFHLYDITSGKLSNSISILPTIKDTLILHCSINTMKKNQVILPSIRSIPLGKKYPPTTSKNLQYILMTLEYPQDLSDVRIVSHSTLIKPYTYSRHLYNR